VWGDELEGKTVLWQTDNSTTHWSVTKWKSRSWELNVALRLLHIWTRLRNVTLVTVHVPGETNVVADWLSRMRDSTDWQLHPILFKAIMRKTMWCKVDAFATSSNHLLPRFWSLHRELGAESVNFFAQALARHKLWMNPPFNLIARVLEELTRQGARGVILVPVWETKAWWPVLLQMCVRPPVQVPLRADTFRPVSRHNMAGVGVPRWPVWAVQVSGVAWEQRKAREVWGDYLLVPDMSLVEECGLLLHAHEVRDDIALSRRLAHVHML